MQPLNVVRSSLAEGSYVLSAVVASPAWASPQLVAATSEGILRQYDTRQFSHVRDIAGHNGSITDVVTNGNLILSSQSDTGVMITDLRTGQPIRFLTELQHDGLEGNSVDINPAGTSIAVGAGQNVHFVDPRTWSATRVLAEAHCDDVTKVRFVSDSMVATGGEDMMIHFWNAALPDKDALRCAVSCGEAITRATFFPELNSIGMVGTLEGAYLFEVPQDPEADFPPEFAMKRGTEFARYCPDWLELRGTPYIMLGHNTAFDDAMSPEQVGEELAPAPQPLTLRCPPRAVENGAVETMTFAPVHSDIVRVALSLGKDRVVTAGEDGTIAVWPSSPSAAADDDNDDDEDSEAARPVGNGAGAVSHAKDAGGRHRGVPPRGGFKA